MAGPGHLSPARAEIRTGGGKSRNNSASIKTWRRISGSDASPKKKKGVMLMKQYKAQVLQLMLVSPSQTNWVV